MEIKITDVKKAAKKHLHLTNPQVKQLGSGSSNTNFIVDHKYLVRVNANPNKKNKISKEFKILRYLEKYHLAPKPYIKDISKRIIPQDYLIIEFIPGHDLRKVKFSNKVIKDLAKLTATLHSVPVTKEIPPFRKSYLDVKNNITKLINLTRKYGGTIESDYLQNIATKLNIHGPPNKVSIAHGDICEQNLVYNKSNTLKFIDFESCGISDPAYDIADIFTGFGKDFKTTHQNLFFKEYLTQKKDNTLIDRVKVFIPLKMFETFCWSIMHVYEIKAGVVSKDIQNKEPIQHHIHYTLQCMKKCKQLGLISNTKIKLFSQK